MSNSEIARLSHIAFLVPSVAKAAAVAANYGFESGPPEAWEGEDTLEIYVGNSSKNGRLLLMEPAKDGAYSRALNKRGPGLHHVAVDVLDLENYILQLSGSGWLLHPRSLQTMRASNTAYMARPGVNTLIEVQGCADLPQNPNFITLLEMPILASRLQMIERIGVPEFAPSKDDQMWLSCDGKRFLASELWDHNGK